MNRESIVCCVCLAAYRRAVRMVAFGRESASDGLQPYGICAAYPQGKSHTDVRFSRIAPGWRLYGDPADGDKCLAYSPIRRNRAVARSRAKPPCAPPEEATTPQPKMRTGRSHRARRPKRPLLYHTKLRTGRSHCAHRPKLSWWKQITSSCFTLCSLFAPFH